MMKMIMMAVKKKQRANRRRKSNNGVFKKIQLKRKKMRIITVLIRRKGPKEQVVRKVHHQKGSVRHQMKMIMEMMMTLLLKLHLFNRNSKWKTSLRNLKISLSLKNHFIKTNRELLMNFSIKKSC